MKQKTNGNDRLGGSWLGRLPYQIKTSLCRQVTKASLRHTTMERQCLRWWMSARPCIHPLQLIVKTKQKARKSFTSVQMVHTHTQLKSAVNSPQFLLNVPENLLVTCIHHVPSLGENCPSWPATICDWTVPRVCPVTSAQGVSRGPGKTAGPSDAKCLAVRLGCGGWRHPIKKI